MSLTGEMLVCLLPEDSPLFGDPGAVDSPPKSTGRGSLTHSVFSNTAAGTGSHGAYGGGVGVGVGIAATAAGIVAAGKVEKEVWGADDEE